MTHMRAIAALTIMSSLALTLAGCTTATGKAKSPAEPAAISKAEVAGKAAYSRGDFGVAGKIFIEELRRAWALDDAAKTATAAYNLALCHLALGQYDKAREHAREARAEYHRLGQSGVASCWILEAKAARGQRQFDEVPRLLDSAMRAIRGEKRGATVAQIRALRASSACDRGDAIGARLETSRAIAASGKKLTTEFRAELSVVAGRIYLLEDTAAKAAGEFKRASEGFRKINRPREMAAAIVKAGKAYEVAGMPREAAMHYFRGGRSLFVQGEIDGSIRWLQLAFEQAVKSRDEDLQKRSEALKKAIQDHKTNMALNMKKS